MQDKVVTYVIANIWISISARYHCEEKKRFSLKNCIFKKMLMAIVRDDYITFAIVLNPHRGHCNLALTNSLRNTLQQWTDETSWDLAEFGWDLAECGGDLAECGWDLAECGRNLAECGWDLAECGWDLAECGWDLAVCGWDLADSIYDLAECGWDLAKCGWDLAWCGWDLASWLDRQTANNEDATVLGSIPVFSDTMESEGRQIKQCWIKYCK